MTASVVGGDPEPPGPSRQPAAAAGSLTARVAAIVAVFVAIVACLVFLAGFGLEILSAVRAYVGGEGLWSKAQKDATHHLIRYAMSRDPREFERYRAALAVPLGDRRAREALDRPRANRAVAEAGFVEGRNHVDDVANMATLFRRFRRVSYMAIAIGIWEKGDAEIATLQRLGSDLHEEIAVRGGNPERVQRILDAVDAVNGRLTRLEDEFSYTLGEGARRIKTLLTRVIVGTAAVLVAAGILLSIRIVRRIKESDRRYRHLLDSANDAVLVSDAETGIVVDANRRAEQLLGLPLAEIIGSRQQDFHGRSERERWQQLLERDLVAGPAAPVELHLRHESGRLVPVEVSASAAEVGGRRVVQSILRDITERKRAEAALRQREEQLRQSQKMEAVGTLAGGVAHDFNNIMTVVTLRADLLLRRLDPAAPVYRDVDVIKKAADRATDLTRQLLAFSRKQVLQPRVLDLNERIVAIGVMLQRLIGENIELCVEAADGLWPTMADPGQIDQVLVNLVVNARDAMPHGGRLTIRTANVAAAAAELAELVRPRECVMLSVTDTGVGMDEETRARVFEPFFTTKGPGQGTGLGLAMVYGIVTQHEGAVTVASDPGRGSAFAIYLPRAEAQAEAEADVVRGGAARGTETVLLVEDESEVRGLARDILESSGYTVLTAETPEQAEGIARDYPGRIDLLLSDVVMPRRNGPAVARQVTAIRGAIKVVYMSGYSDDMLGSHEVLATGTMLLSKPFTIEALLGTVRGALDGRPGVRS